MQAILIKLSRLYFKIYEIEERFSGKKKSGKGVRKGKGQEFDQNIILYIKVSKNK